MKVLIVDDEPLARMRLASLLAEHADVQVCGEAANALDARAAIDQLNPDAVFLDVRMPLGNGLDLARSLLEHLGRRPWIIMVTAHAEFAVDAFEVRVVDYLLKPIRRSRLAQALERVREQMRNASISVSTSHDPSRGFRIAVRSGDAISFVAAPEIELVEAAGNYLVLVCGKTRHVIRETLADMERQLPTHEFLRLNRSTLANTRFVDHVESLAPGQYEVVMKNGRRVKTTRRLKELKSALLPETRLAS